MKEIMRSEVFTTAWKIKKHTGCSLSEALRNAWTSIKNKIKLVFNVSFDKIQFVTYVKETIASGKVFGTTAIQAVQMAAEYVPASQTGAQFYYDGKTYNAD